MTLATAIEATDGAARTGSISTPRGTVTTPVFMPVGTRGAVRHLDSTDLASLGAEVVLANTYHLMCKPGAEVIAALGGLHAFSGWNGHVLTDSGGYQVFSLEPKVTEDGVRFKSTYDGTTMVLTPESAVTVQDQLGADIQMVLDVCPPLPSPERVVRAAAERTARWARRAREAFLAGERTGHQFGIVQGGTDETLRRRSARQTVETGFDGYAVGGLSVGEPRTAMLDALGAALAELPADRPRYLMGVGDPVGMVEAIAAGIDMFDCVLPTRHARHGTMLTGAGRLNLKNARFATDEAPIDPDCGCPVCGRWSRAYLRHLLKVDEPTGPRLLTVHNLWWLLDLVARARRAIAAGTFDSLRREVADRHG